MSNAFLKDSAGNAVEILTLTGNDAIAVPPNGAGNLDILGSGAIAVTGVIGTNTLTISTSSGGISWSDESGAFSPLKGNGYFITATATGTLPVAPADGDTIAFNVIIGNVLTIQAAGTQLIRVGDAISGAGGTAASTAIGDSIVLVYRLSSTTWHALSSIGIWDIV